MVIVEVPPGGIHGAWVYARLVDSDNLLVITHVGVRKRESCQDVKRSRLEIAMGGSRKNNAERKDVNG